MYNLLKKHSLNKRKKIRRFSWALIVKIILIYTISFIDLNNI